MEKKEEIVSLNEVLSPIELEEISFEELEERLELAPTCGIHTCPYVE